MRFLILLPTKSAFYIKKIVARLLGNTKAKHLHPYKINFIGGKVPELLEELRHADVIALYSTEQPRGLSPYFR